MAKEFEFDDRALSEEFDLGDNFGDLNVPPHRLAAAAKSIGTIVSESAPEMIKGVTSSLKFHLPNIRDTIDEGVNAIDDFKRLKEDISKELDPALQTLRQIGLRVLPKARRFMPKHMYNTIDNSIRSGIKEEQRVLSDEERLAQSNKATVDDAMSRIFAGHSGMSKEGAVETETQKIIDRQLESTRFKSTSKNLMVLGDGLQSVHGFMQTTFMEYMKKDIELKYNHLFIAKDTFNLIKVLNANVDRKLEELKHNTAIPDSMKIKDPRFAKKTGSSDNTNDYFTNFRKALTGNVRDAVMGPLQMVTQMGIPLLDMMTSGGGGFSLPSLIGRGLGMAGRWYLGKKTDEFADKNRSSFNILNRYTANLKERGIMKLLNWGNKNQYEGGLIGWLANLIPSLTPNLSVRNNLVSGASEPATFDNLTRQSIVEIIPAHLANIGKYVAGLAKAIAPGQKFQDITFNMAKRTITDVESAGTDLLASHGVDDTSVRLMNEESMNTMKRAALYAKKQRYKSAAGQRTISQIESIDKELMKFFTNSGLMRRPFDIESFRKASVDPFFMSYSDYMRDVLDGIDDKEGFISSILATVTDDKTGEIDPTAVAMIENAIINHTKKINLVAHVGNISNTYGQSGSLKELGVLDENGQISREGIRDFYSRRNNQPAKYYKEDGTEYTKEELKQKGIQDYSNYSFQAEQNSDYTDLVKAKKLLYDLKKTKPDDPRVAMLESNNPLMIATALAMGNEDTIKNKFVMGIGKAGKWAYDLGMQGVDKVKEFMQPAEDMFGDFMDSELGQDLKGGIGTAKSEFKVNAVQRVSGRKFQITAIGTSGSTEKVVITTDVYYKAGSFPDRNTIIRLSKKKNWKFDPEVQVIYSDIGKVEEDIKEEEKATTATSFDALNRIVTSNPLDIVPDYLQKILEAIYIVNGRAKDIPKVSATYRPPSPGPGGPGPAPAPGGAGIPVRPTPPAPPAGGGAAATVTPSAPVTPTVTTEPPKAKVPTAEEVMNQKSKLAQTFDGGITSALTDLTGAAVESYDVVRDDLGRYADSLIAFLPTKESFLSHLPESCRERAGKIWDACAKVGGTFHEFCTHYKKEFVSIPKVAECIDKLEECASKLHDPEQRKQLVADTLARCQNIVETIKDPEKREKAYDEMKELLAKQIENAEDATKAEFERREKQGWWQTTKEDLKKLWAKFQNSWLYKKVSSWIPPEVKEKIKKDFMAAKKDIMSIWDDTTEDVKKQFKKYSGEEVDEKEAAEKAGSATLVEDGMEDPELLKLMQQQKQAQEEAAKLQPKQKAKGSWLSRRLRVAKRKRTMKKKAAAAAKEASTTEATSEAPIDYDDDTAAAQNLAREISAEREKTSAEKAEEKKQAEKKAGFWQGLTTSLSSITNFFKKKEETDAEETKAKKAKGSDKDFGFKGTDDLSGFHTDFVTYATAALPLLKEIAWNSSFGFGKTIASIAKSGAGLLGHTVGGLATAYAGLARGAGSAIGGIARGIGSVAGGLANSGLLGGIAGGLGSLAGGMARGLGAGMKGLGYAAGGAASGLGHLGGGLLNSLFGTGPAWAGFKNLGRRITRPRYIDIYRKDKIEPGKPLLSAKQQEEGVFFADGTRVKNSMDIKAPVFMKVEGDDNPKTMISDEDLKAGLCDAQGKPLNEDGSFKFGALNIGGLAATLLTGAGALLSGAAAGYGKLLSALGLGIKTTAKVGTTLLGRLFGIDTDGNIKYHNDVIDRLDQMIQILTGSHYVSYTKEEAANDKKKEESEKAKAEQALKDKENDERRLDASEQDALRKKKEQEQAATAAAAAAAGGAGGPGGLNGSPNGNKNPNGPGGQGGGLTTGEVVGTTVTTGVVGGLIKKTYGKAKNAVRTMRQTANTNKAIKLHKEAVEGTKQAKAMYAEAERLRKAGRFAEADEMTLAAKEAADKANKARTGAKRAAGKASKAREAAEKAAGKTDDAAATAGKGPKSKLGKKMLNKLSRVWKTRGGKWAIIVGAVLAAGAAAWWYFSKKEPDPETENLKRRLIPLLANQIDSSALSDEEKEQLRIALDEMAKCTEIEGVQGYAASINAEIISGNAKAGKEGTSAAKTAAATTATATTATATMPDNLSQTVPRSSSVGGSTQDMPRFKGSVQAQRRFNLRTEAELQNAQQKLANAKTPEDKEFWSKQVARLTAIRDNALKTTGASAEVKTEAAAANPLRKAYIENSTNASGSDELSKLMQDVNKKYEEEQDRTGSTRNTNEYTISENDIGKEVILDGGKKVLITRENFDQYQGLTAYRSNTVRKLDKASDVADQVAAASIAKGALDVTNKAGSALAKTSWMQKAGTALANTKAGQTLLNLATKVGSSGAGQAAGGLMKLTGAAGSKVLGLAGKVGPHLMLAQAAYGAGRGLLMDEKERKEFYHERGKGAFGGGRFLDGEGFSRNMANLADIYKKKGFWSGTGHALRMVGNDAIGLVDFVEHGKTIGAFTREAFGTAGQWIDAYHGAKAAETVTTKSGEKMSRTDFLLKNRLSRLEQPLTKQVLGPELSSLLKEKITIAYKEQGAPDHPFGRACANAAANLIGVDKPEEFVKRLDAVLANLSKNDAAHVYVFKGANELLEQARARAIAVIKAGTDQSVQGEAASTTAKAEAKAEADKSPSAAQPPAVDETTVKDISGISLAQARARLKMAKGRTQKTFWESKVHHLEVLAKNRTKSGDAGASAPAAPAAAKTGGTSLTSNEISGKNAKLRAQIRRDLLLQYQGKTLSDKEYNELREKLMSTYPFIRQTNKQNAVRDMRKAGIKQSTGLETPAPAKPTTSSAADAAVAKAEAKAEADKSPNTVTPAMPIKKSSPVTISQPNKSTISEAKSSDKGFGPAKFKITAAEIEAVDTPKRTDGKATDFAVRKALEQKYGASFKKLHPRMRDQYVRAIYEQYLKSVSTKAVKPTSADKKESVNTAVTNAKAKVEAEPKQVSAKDAYTYGSFVLTKAEILKKMKEEDVTRPTSSLITELLENKYGDKFEDLGSTERRRIIMFMVQLSSKDLKGAQASTVTKTTTDKASAGTDAGTKSDKKETAAKANEWTTDGFTVTAAEMKKILQDHGGDETDVPIDGSDISGFLEEKYGDKFTNLNEVEREKISDLIAFNYNQHLKAAQAGRKAEEPTTPPAPQKVKPEAKAAVAKAEAQAAKLPASPSAAKSPTVSAKATKLAGTKSYVTVDAASGSITTKVKGTIQGNCLLPEADESSESYNQRLQRLRLENKSILSYETEEGRKSAAAGKAMKDRNMETHRLATQHQELEKRRSAIAAKISAGQPLTEEENKLFFGAANDASSELDDGESAPPQKVAPASPPAPQKVKPSITTNTDRITQKYSDVAKPIDVKDSPIVKSYAEPATPATPAEKDDEWLKKFTAQNESGLERQNLLLEKLCSLMAMNIQATRGAGTGITSRINDSSEKLLNTSLTYTNSLVKEVTPKKGPVKPRPSAIDVSKMSAVPA